MLLAKYKSGKIVSQHQEEFIKQLDINMKDFFIKNGIKYVSRYNLFCPEGKCPVLSKSNIPLFIDSAHWSKAGAEYFGDKIKQNDIDKLFYASPD